MYADLCLTLCDPMDCSPPGSSVHGILRARILEWVAMPLLQGIFPTQEWNPYLLHCRQILYQATREAVLVYSLCLICQGRTREAPRFSDVETEAPETCTTLTQGTLGRDDRDTSCPHSGAPPTTQGTVGKLSRPQRQLLVAWVEC